MYRDSIIDGVQALIPATVPDIWLYVCTVMLMYCVHNLWFAATYNVYVCVFLCRDRIGFSSGTLCMILLLLAPHSASTSCKHCSTCCRPCRHHCSNCCSCVTALGYFPHPDLHCYLVSTTWLSHDHHMTVTWLSHDHHMTVTWPPHDCHLTTTWPSHDCHLTTTWPSHDCHMTVTWLSHDRHMTVTWPNVFTKRYLNNIRQW